jgi:cell division protein FtsN
VATSTPGGGQPPGTPTAAAPPPTTSSAVAAASPTDAAAGPFEIVIASFRTASRAADVAAQVTTLGQPVRLRTSGAWQQVLAGPYASRAAAADAQDRLARAGLTGTQLMPAGR